MINSKFFLIDFSQPSLYTSIFFIILCPILYNLLARLEYFYKSISKIFNGDKKRANKVYSFFMMLVGIIRNYFYYEALKVQPTISYESYDQLLFTLSIFVAAFGLTLIIFSSFRLGVRGVYYADYFDIKMDFTVNVFPYNIISDPLYVGTTMCFLSYALYKGSLAGLMLTSGVLLMYMVALRFEDEMLKIIYPNDNKLNSNEKSEGKTENQK